MALGIIANSKVPLDNISKVYHLDWFSAASPQQLPASPSSLNKPGPLVCSTVIAVLSHNCLAVPQSAVKSTAIKTFPGSLSEAIGTSSNWVIAMLLKLNKEESPSTPRASKQTWNRTVLSATTNPKVSSGGST